MGPPVKTTLLRSPPSALGLVRVGQVEPLKDSSGHWLIEKLWTERAVGVLGGAPKSFKTWLAVDLALSVASGTKALGCFPVRQPGPVVFFGAEDAPALLRERFAALASHRTLALERLDVFLLDVPVLHLDREKDQIQLSQTIRSAKPRLLVLDPLVRMHSLDENSASEISGLLSFLRRLEREHEVAILLVHHTRKHAGAGTQPGQGLRGSSDIHAWGDSNLYLRRARDGLLLTVEHRSAPTPAPVSLKLLSEPTPHLEVLEGSSAETGGEASASSNSFLDEVLWHLQDSTGPLRVDDLRARLRVRKQRIIDALRELVASGLVQRSGDGFLPQTTPPEPE